MIGVLARWNFGFSPLALTYQPVERYGRARHGLSQPEKNFP